MKKVALITGGAGGMGLAVAKILGREYEVVIADLQRNRLDSARNELSLAGISCSAQQCDITDRQSVEQLFAHAAEKGSLACVIHTAGISPQMADPKTIMNVNAVGTINVTEAALAVAGNGFALVNVASMAAYMVPDLLIPKRAFAFALKDKAAFLKKALFPSHFLPTAFYRRGISYAISKRFVIWYSQKMSVAFGKKGARVLSVSPGTFDTDMGRLEEKSGSVELLKKSALNRVGNPVEIAEVIAFCASERASYMTGTDVLCDGGVVAARA